MLFGHWDSCTGVTAGSPEQVLGQQAPGEAPGREGSRGKKHLCSPGKASPTSQPCHSGKPARKDL